MVVCSVLRSDVGCFEEYLTLFNLEGARLRRR